MTSLTNFCHNYHVTPSSNKRRTLSTTVQSVFIGIVRHFWSWKFLLLLSFIDLFLNGEIDVKATEANFFQSSFFLILMSF